MLQPRPPLPSSDVKEGAPAVRRHRHGHRPRAVGSFWGRYRGPGSTRRR